MLSAQGNLHLSPYSDLYDLIVPKDNQFRQFKELCNDFDFIYDELKCKYCPDNGRTAIDPRVMFKYLLIKVIDNWSDVDVVEQSRYNMAYKCFLGLPPEQTEMIDPSSLTRFRRQRLQDPELMDKLISQSLKVAAEHGLIKSKSIIMDSTHTRSRANRRYPSEYLQKLGKDLRKSLYRFDESVKKDLPEKYEGEDIEKAMSYAESLVQAVSEMPLSQLPGVSKHLNLLKEAIDDIQDHFECSADSDARTGHKSEDDEFFGYKTHMAINQERLVTAAVVTSGETADGDYMQELIDKSRENGQEVDEAIGDGAYSSNENLEECERKGVKVIAKLNANVVQGCRKEDGGFSFNKDAGMYVCPAGHMAVRKAVAKARDNVAARVRRDGVKASCISVIIRGNDMKKHSHQRMLDEPTDSTSRTYEVAKELYRQLWDGRTGLRLIGLAMTQIDRDGEQQLSLFDALGSGSTAEEDERDHKADEAVDALREKFGDDIIKRGGMLGSNIRPRKRK